MAADRPSILTPANLVTFVRVMLVPVWLLIAEMARSGGDVALAWSTFILYVCISLTDKLDGWLARSRGEVTTLGKFLDPIADKLAVIVALLFLLELEEVGSWVVLTIIAREFIVDGIRMVVAAQGVVIDASKLGKWKTAITMIAICGLLLGFVAASGAISDEFSSFVVPLIQLSGVLVYVAVALTIWSGADYLVKSLPAIVNG